MPVAPRVALIGFMGSGKSTVGPILAGLLGYEFVDTDELIARRAGASIAEIFQSRGESTFRRLETETLAALARRSALVIATGGGAPAQAANREFFTAGARTFHLRVSFPTVQARTAGDKVRPLLSRGPQAVRKLFDDRLPAYESLGEPVETDGRAPEQIALQIRDLLMRPTR